MNRVIRPIALATAMVLMALGVPGPQLASAAPAQLHPNSQTYREHNPAAATGRSGTAAIAARALLGRTGETDVEVTTGQLDTTVTAGNLAKVQLKALSPSGRVVSTRNYNNLTGGGYWHGRYTDLGRKQSLGVQANVRDKDGNRTDVVSVTATVNARPDLTVRSITTPPRVSVGAIVHVSATVQELNGDIGAHADCVLYADGVEIDRANGIWVDAGDTVTCAFTVSFGTLGPKQLRVDASGVVPTDWDTSNNSATAIIVIGPPQYDHVSASVTDDDFVNYQYSWGYGSGNALLYYGGYQNTWSGTDHQETWIRDTAYYGSLDGRRFNGAPTLAAASVSVDGIAIHAGLLTAWSTSQWGDTSTGGRCFHSNDVGTVLSAWVDVCSQWSAGTQYSTVQYRTYATGVTYWSQGSASTYNWAYVWNGHGWDYSSKLDSYSWNTVTQSGLGPRDVAIGTRYDFDLALTVDGMTYTGPIAVFPAVSSGSYTAPQSCFGTGDGTSFAYWCVQSWGWSTQAFGTASW